MSPLWLGSERLDTLINVILMFSNYVAESRNIYKCARTSGETITDQKNIKISKTDCLENILEVSFYAVQTGRLAYSNAEFCQDEML